jgi:pentapeptide repeat protein
LTLAARGFAAALALCLLAPATASARFERPIQIERADLACKGTRVLDVHARYGDVRRGLERRYRGGRHRLSLRAVVRDRRGDTVVSLRHRSAHRVAVTGTPVLDYVHRIRVPRSVCRAPRPLTVSVRASQVATRGSARTSQSRRRVVAASVASAAYPVVNGCTIKPLTQCFGADLSQQDLSGASLLGAILIGADLTGANLSKAGMEYVNLNTATAPNLNATGTVLAYAGLANATLTGATFAGAEMQRANLATSALRGASFNGANLMWSSFAQVDLTNVDFRGANLTGGGFTFPTLSNTLCDDKTILPGQPPNRWTCSGGVLSLF